MARLSTEYLRASLLRGRSQRDTPITTLSPQPPTPTQNYITPQNNQDEYAFYRRQGIIITRLEDTIEVKSKARKKLARDIKVLQNEGYDTTRLQERLTKTENDISNYRAQLETKKAELGPNYNAARQIAPQQYNTGQMNKEQGITFVSSKIAQQREVMRLAKEGNANYQTTTGEVQQVTYQENKPFSQLGEKQVPYSGITAELAKKGLFGGTNTLAKVSYNPIEERQAPVKNIDFTAQYGYTQKSGSSVIFFRSPSVRPQKEIAPKNFQEQRQQDINTLSRLRKEYRGDVKPIGSFILSRPVGIIGGLLERNTPKAETFLAQRYEQNPQRATLYAYRTSVNVRNLGTYARTNSIQATREGIIAYSGGAIIGGSLKVAEASLYAWRGAKAVKTLQYGTMGTFAGITAYDIATTKQGQLGVKVPYYVIGGAGYLKGEKLAFPNDGIRAKTTTLQITGTEERTVGNDIFITGTAKVPVETTLYGKTTTSIETAQISGIKTQKDLLKITSSGKEKPIITINKVSSYDLSLDIGMRMGKKDVFTSFKGKQIGQEVFLVNPEGTFYAGRSRPILSANGVSRSRGNFIVLETQQGVPRVMNIGGFTGTSSQFGFSRYQGGVYKKEGLFLSGKKNTYASGISASITTQKGGTRDIALFRKTFSVLRDEYPLMEPTPVKERDAFGFTIGKRGELRPAMQETILEPQRTFEPRFKNRYPQERFTYLEGLPIRTPRIAPERSLRIFPTYRQKSITKSNTITLNAQRYDTIPSNDQRIEPSTITTIKPIQNTYKKTDVIYQKIPSFKTDTVTRNPYIPIIGTPPNVPPPIIPPRGFGGSFGFGYGGGISGSTKRRRYGSSLTLYDVTFFGGGRAISAPRGGFTGLEISRLMRRSKGRKKR